MPLPLMSFFCWHSNMSHKHHKWSFCLINSVDILYIQNVHLFGAFDPEKHGFQLEQRDNKISQKLPVNFAKTFQTTFVIQLQVFFNVNNRQYTLSDPRSRWPYFFITQRNNLNQFVKTVDIQWKRQELQDKIWIPNENQLKRVTPKKYI